MRESNISKKKTKKVKCENSSAMGQKIKLSEVFIINELLNILFYSAY